MILDTRLKTFLAFLNESFSSSQNSRIKQVVATAEVSDSEDAKKVIDLLNLRTHVVIKVHCKNKVGRKLSFKNGMVEAKVKDLVGQQLLQLEKELFKDCELFLEVIYWDESQLFKINKEFLIFDYDEDKLFESVK